MYYIPIKFFLQFFFQLKNVCTYFVATKKYKHDLKTAHGKSDKLLYYIKRHLIYDLLN